MPRPALNSQRLGDAARRPAWERFALGAPERDQTSVSSVETRIPKIDEIARPSCIGHHCVSLEESACMEGLSPDALLQIADPSVYALCDLVCGSIAGRLERASVGQRAFARAGGRRQVKRSAATRAP